MKNKSMYITRLIYSIVATGFLIYFFIKTTNGKMIFIPFLICVFSQVIKNILMILNKKEYAKIFDKVFVFGFLLFWFGFLIYWCYSSIRDKNYTLLLPTIPFWIVSIYIIKKRLFKTNIEDKSRKETKINFKIIISAFLVGICLLSGVAMLFFGIKDTYKLNKISKDYITTNGYFSNYDIYRSDENGITYRLTYTYKVDDMEYTVSTDYGTNYIPKENSTREIKYNPEKPEESILVGTNSKNGMIFIGAFFTFGSFAFILGACSVLGYFDKYKIDIMGIYFGILFFIIGIGIIAFLNGTTGSFTETIKTLGLWILIPIIFIVVGIIQIAKCSLKKKNN